MVILAIGKDERLNTDAVSISSGGDTHTDIFTPSLQDNLFCEDRDELISRVFFWFRYDVVVKSRE